MTERIIDTDAFKPVGNAANRVVEKMKQQNEAVAANQFAVWRSLLAGTQPVLDPNEPPSGYYRVRRGKDGPWLAVAVWRDNVGKLWCVRYDGERPEAVESSAIWPWCGRYPIPYETFQAYITTGRWPGDHEAVTRSNLAPADNSFEGVRDAIEDLAREAAKITEAKSQEEADRAADLANKLAELEKKADFARRAERRPHEEAARAANDKWNPVRDTAEAAKRKLKSIIGIFLAAKAKAEEAARSAAIQAGEPIAEPARGSTTKAGTRGRAVSLKTIKRAEIVDREKLLAHFAAHPRIDEALLDLANQAVRAGIVPPGVKIVEEKIAA